MKGPQINEHGEAGTFPMFFACCGWTRWYEPNDVYDKECTNCGTLDETGENNLGVLWWKALYTQGERSGKDKAEESAGIEPTYQGIESPSVTSELAPSAEVEV